MTIKKELDNQELIENNEYISPLTQTFIFECYDSLSFKEKRCMKT